MPAGRMREPLRGWRVWRVVDTDGPALLSWWLSTIWPAREALRAGCAIHGSRPAARHMCGIHAFAERGGALACAGLRRPRLAPFDPHVLAVVVGQVSGWGRAVAHVKGWRAELAYPYDLYVLSADGGVARALADRYAVDAAPWPPANWAVLGP
jgi:hypothetical protein